MCSRTETNGLKAKDRMRTELSRIEGYLESCNRVIKHSDLLRLILWFNIQKEAWFKSHDVTGRIALVAKKSKLRRAFVLLPLDKS